MRYKFICSVAHVAFMIATPAIASSTLYERLGGLENIKGIVSQTIDRTAADPQTQPIFEGIKLAPVKESVTMHLCEISGGPCRYDGAPMAKAHSGMGITSKQFDLMDAYLSQSLTDHGVKDADKANLARLLKPLKPEIIEK